MSGQPDVDDVDRALAALSERALLVTGPVLRLVEAARFAWTSPLGLGPSAEHLLTLRTVDQMKSMCSRLGAKPPARKAEVIETLLSTLRDGFHIRSIVHSATEETRDLLVRVATTGEEAKQYGYYSPRSFSNTPVQWAVARGLLMSSSDWSDDLVMPAEVSLALRGPDYIAPFHPRPPHCARVATDPGIVARDAAAAAGGFLRLVSVVLDEAGRSPIAALRQGGVGVRELKRLAKAHATTTDQVKLALATARGARLLDTFGTVPTDHYDSWLEMAPAERLAELVRAWWTLPCSPLARPEAAWIPAEEDDGTDDLRAALLAAAATPRGEAVVDVPSLTELLRWTHPHVLRRHRSRFAAHVDACWREAAALGLVGAATVSDAGRALLAGDPDALRASLRGVGEVVRTAHLQADLTAVVPGTPDPELVGLLDAAADRESVAAASTWRFSQASVRRALDAGHTADALLAELTERAAGAVPQTLDYLIRDVSRRHGAVRASEALSCLRADDVALLAEVAADRKLRALGLRLVAPTVITSQKPLAETLTALRAAGYSPMPETADGTAIVAETPRRRATVRGHDEVNRHDERVARAAAARRAASARTVTPRSGVRGLARNLLARPDQIPAPAPALSVIERLAETLRADIHVRIDDVLPEETRDRTPYLPPWQRRRWG